MRPPSHVNATRSLICKPPKYHPLPPRFRCVSGSSALRQLVNKEDLLSSKLAIMQLKISTFRHEKHFFQPSTLKKGLFCSGKSAGLLRGGSVLIGPFELTVGRRFPRSPESSVRYCSNVIAILLRQSARVHST
jgi:hypothetical protein